ncbi:hypothetical protein ACWEPM_38140 [Streptomyces sp. NPDC004244]
MQLTDTPVMRYDCLRGVFTPGTFQNFLAVALAALARLGIDTVPATKGPVCLVRPDDPLVATIRDMIGPDGVRRRVEEMRAALRVQEEARLQRENVAKAVGRHLHMIVRSAHRLLRQARELGLQPADPLSAADNDGRP